VIGVFRPGQCGACCNAPLKSLQRSGTRLSSLRLIRVERVLARGQLSLKDDAYEGSSVFVGVVAGDVWLHQQQQSATPETDDRDRSGGFQDDRDLPGRNKPALPVSNLRRSDQCCSANVE
jgi:hypothetical protein